MKKKSASQSAFFKLRVLVAVFLCFAAITLVFFAFGKASAQPRPSAQNQQPLIRAQYRGVMPVVKFDISPPLRTIKPLFAKTCTKSENEEEGPINAPSSADSAMIAAQPRLRSYRSYPPQAEYRITT